MRNRYRTKLLLMNLKLLAISLEVIIILIFLESVKAKNLNLCPNTIIVLTVNGILKVW